MVIIQAKTPEHLDEIRCLFREYEQFLGVDLCFQSFEEELENLPGDYVEPSGALLIAEDGIQVLGCVALRELNDGICEMKRLYIRPQYRRRGIGRLLSQNIIEKAITMGYSIMRLDTLNILKEANRLYESLGFKKTSPYYNNPLPGVVYWELSLGDK